MKCDDAQKLLGSYFDGELDGGRSLEMEEHLRACATCSSAQQQLTRLREVTQTAYFPAPPDLRADVLAALRAEVPAAPPPRQVPQPWLLRGLPLAAAILLGFFLGQTFYRNPARQVLLAELTDSHVRSLVGTHLTDVVSSDQHTVRPWFEGKLDFAPPVPDLSAQGFPLVGGRIEYIGGRAVAALVYERRKHFINLFIWPEAGEAGVTAEPSQRGYNVMHWRHNGMTLFAVSEVSQQDIRKFADAFSAATSPTP